MARHYATPDPQRVNLITDRQGNHPGIFNLHYVPKNGQLYSVGGVYFADDDIVEVFDAEYVDRPASHGHPLGQYVASYYVSTLMTGPRPESRATGRFSFNGGVPAWSVDGETWNSALRWVAEQGAPSADKARILAGHKVWDPADRPVCSAALGARAARGESYGPAEAFRPYSGTDGLRGGWYAKFGTADCGHAYNNVGTDGLAGISVGYAIDATTDQTKCFDCVRAEERKRLAEPKSGGRRPGKFYGYVAGDGVVGDPYRLATWSGGSLAKVIFQRASTNDIGTVWSWVFESDDGRTYYGKNGGPGMAITVRAHTRRPAYLPKFKPASEENQR